MESFARSDVVQAFLDFYERPAYLEVGVSHGLTFHVLRAARKVAVDPKFWIPADRREPSSLYNEVTSDTYFRDLHPRGALFDVIYLDGLHTFEQTLRDLNNAITCLQQNGVIIIDDTVPNSYHAGLPDEADFNIAREAVGSQDGSWMGDVYRLVFFIQTFFPQFRYATVAENHGQTVLWRGRRESTERAVEDVASVAALGFLDVVKRGAAFNRRPCAGIVADARRDLISPG